MPTYIPSPSQGVWNLGPLPIRAYALLIIVGIIVAIWWGSKRYVARGGAIGAISTIAIWAVPFGIVGGRLYHVITDWQIYFGANGKGFWAAFRIWDGGLGIWGAIALGAVGAWIAARRMHIPMPPVADAVAPGIAIAQAIGRWGNYFNQELYGAPTTLPWGLEIDAAHAPHDAAGNLIYPVGTVFQPTFLYESLWMIGVAVALVLVDRRWRIGHGRVFALYVFLYCCGRVWIEALRIDSANTILGLRLNVWTAIIVGIGGLVYFIVVGRLRPGRETPEEIQGIREVVPESGANESPDDSEETSTTSTESADGESREPDHQ